MFVSHLVPAIKQDIASTEYGVSPAAVKSPGTKMTIANFQALKVPDDIFHNNSCWHTVPTWAVFFIRKKEQSFLLKSVSCKKKLCAPSRDPPEIILLTALPNFCIMSIIEFLSVLPLLAV